MPVLTPAALKLMVLILAGTVILQPTPQEKQAVGKITKTYIQYKEKKLPITNGFKPGKDPLPQNGRTPYENYKQAWDLIKQELGFK